MNDETKLLYSVLCFEEGHSRRTQHILKVYALAKLFGEQERLSGEEKRILQAAAILHDIAIKPCKERYDGDASQENQKKEAPRLVREFLTAADYLPDDIPKITGLVLRHHDYHGEKTKLLQLLIEADLIVNCYEEELTSERAEAVRTVFRTANGKRLLELCLKEAGV